MAQTAKPFSWVVRFTVAPLWVQDGFTVSDERALDMLARAIGGAHEGEASAAVLEAPSPLQIATMQGYSKESRASGSIVRQLIADTPKAGQLHAALIAARSLLDSVAFVSREGDTAPVLAKIDAALALIDARQGAPVAVEE